MTRSESSTSKNIFEIGLCLICWFALVLQLLLLKESFFNFISYFTILSNLLIAISLTTTLISANTSTGKYFSDIKVQTGIALNIFVVSLVYNTILRGIWEPKGWQLVADNLLHVAVPVLYVLYWIVFIPKGLLKWKNGIQWTYFPLTYLIYSLVRGHFVGWYPYPFLNVVEFGYQKVFTNAGFIMLAFFLFGWLMIWVDGLKKVEKTIV